MPRKVVYQSQLPGDPQTLLQGDRDPMLTMQPDYLDCRPDPDPAGDLGKKCRKKVLVYLLLAHNFLVYFGIILFQIYCILHSSSDINIFFILGLQRIEILFSMCCNNVFYFVNSLLWSVGLRFPIYKAMSRDQALPAVSDSVIEAKITEIDVSDLGTRSYAARTDFYCLVTDEL